MIISILIEYLHVSCMGLDKRMSKVLMVPRILFL